MHKSPWSKTAKACKKHVMCNAFVYSNTKVAKSMYVRGDVGMGAMYKVQLHPQLLKKIQNSEEEKTITKYCH